jgi:site-specific recombinase XerD
MAIGLHGLRHIHATVLLEAGVDVKTESERLGHDSVQTTLELHGLVTHSSPGLNSPPRLKCR